MPRREFPNSALRIKRIIRMLPALYRLEGNLHVYLLSHKIFIIIKCYIGIPRGRSRIRFRPLIGCYPEFWVAEAAAIKRCTRPPLPSLSILKLITEHMDGLVHLYLKWSDSLARAAQFLEHKIAEGKYRKLHYYVYAACLSALCLNS